MVNELKGRYANYYTGDKTNGTVERQVRLSLNAVKTNFGADIARLILIHKRFDFGNTHWFELELLPGEKNMDETAREKLKIDLVQALYGDLHESYPLLTYAWLLAEADKQLAGAKPTGGPSMWIYEYLVKAGLRDETNKI